MKILLAFILLIPAFVLAQTTPTVAPVTTTSLLSPAVLAIIASVVLSLNTLLSAVQKIFTTWSKGEPTWLTKLSSIIAKIAQYLGSNPTL